MSSSLVPSRSSSAPVPDNAASTPAGMESFAPQPQDEVGAGHALSRALAALRRFRWLIIGFALAGIGGGIVATRFIKPDYEVAATIWIETPSKGKSGTPIQGEELLDAKAWVELLTTFKVLDPVGMESFAPQPQDEVGAGHALSRALAALRRFRWLIIGFALAGIGGGMGATRFLH